MSIKLEVFLLWKNDFIKSDSKLSLTFFYFFCWVEFSYWLQRQDIQNFQAIVDVFSKWGISSHMFSNVSVSFNCGLQRIFWFFSQTISSVQNKQFNYVSKWQMDARLDFSVTSKSIYQMNISILDVSIKFLNVYLAYWIHNS